MLIDFRTLWPKYNIHPKGVLHIGANVGEEAPVYLELGVKKQIWIEGDAVTFLKLKENLRHNPDAIAEMETINDVDGKVKFNISSNGSQSSSILELGTHKDVHPDVSFVRTEEHDAITIKTLFAKYSLTEWFKKDDYDFLNIDLQGAELKALKGMGSHLKGFKWAYLEVNKAHLYIDCPLIEELDEYLAGYDFVRVETEWAGNTNWGDALWVKKELL